MLPLREGFLQLPRQDGSVRWGLSMAAIPVEKHYWYLSSICHFFRVLGYTDMFCTHIPVSELLSPPYRSRHPLSSVNTDSPAEAMLFLALPSSIHLQRHLEKQFIYTQKYLWSLNTLHGLALLLQLREGTNIGQEEEMYSGSQSYQKSPVKQIWVFR